jgi:hypothetical protein
MAQPSPDRLHAGFILAECASLVDSLRTVNRKLLKSRALASLNGGFSMFSPIPTERTWRPKARALSAH